MSDHRRNLTPSQAAAALGLSTSTLRRWSTDYARHLSPTAGSAGHKRSYTADDLATLTRAQALLKTYSPIEVDQLLGLATDEETPAAVALVTVPTLALEVSNLRAALVQLAGEMAALNARHETDRAELDRLRSEVGGLFDRQRKARERQEAELADMRAEVEALKMRRAWWQRFTRR